MIPRIKISENTFKITNPGKKKLYRIYDKDSRKALADLIALEDEIYDESQPLTIFDPVHTWKQMTITNYTMRQMLVPIFRNGTLVYNTPALLDIQAYAKEEMNSFWDEYMRLNSPQRYKVDLSQPLYDLKKDLLAKGGQVI